MTSRRKGLWALVTGAALAAMALVPTGAAQAQSNFCSHTFGFGAWTSEQDMIDAYGPYCRGTFVDDPGLGNLLSRQGLINADGLYQGQGFDRQWLWYAPETTLYVPSGSGLRWQSCVPLPDGNPPGPTECRSGEFRPNAITTVFDYNPVVLHVFGYDGRFIARGCGNNSVGIAGADPVPTVTGHKFNDTNHNGIRDAGEQGVGGISFQLIRQSSAFGDQGNGVVASTTSDGNGNFRFDLNGQGPGNYTVHEILPADSISTTGTDQSFPVNQGAGSTNVADLQFGNRPQHPPIADAGPAQELDQTSDAGASVTLDGTGSSDPDGDPLTYTWTGPFGTVTGATPTVTMPVGTHTVTLTVSDGLASSSDSTTITIYPPISASAIPQTGVEGAAPRSAAVATFTDPDPAGTAEEYVASIDWGDGTPAGAGTISKGADGTFTVAGAHSYAEEGGYSARVTITDADNSYNTAAVTDGVSIGDAPLTAAGVNDLSTNPVDRTVATFTDANPGGNVSDFTATVDWGDGSTPTAGTITGNAGGTFSVGGRHQYATLGPKTITVHILDDGGAEASAVSKLLLYAFPSAGNFVIGDLNAAVGTSVTYWGAQWSKVNSLSGGAAPDAFKGYADAAAATGWTTDPGNSSHPVSSVPSYLAVIVSDAITQRGSVISGDAPHVVIVRTDPGYQGSPGHEGTGTVVATLR